MPTGFAGRVNEIRDDVPVGKQEIHNWLFLPQTIAGLRAP
jgi:hypothetical protein